MMKMLLYILTFGMLFISCSEDNDVLTNPPNENPLTEGLVELGVNYGPEDRQFLDIYKAASDCPTPIYFDAHGNGGTTAVPGALVDDLNALGITIIAWESYTTLNEANLESGWDDAELMFQWVIDNAETYNLDTSNMIIGGSSRGSVISWPYGHRPNPNIKGLYMYNALPNSVWTSDAWIPTEDVTPSSPPIYFVYKREPGSTTHPTDPDFHDPNNGVTIVNQYERLGIGDRATLVHSIGETDNSDKYQFLVEFVLSLIDTCP